MHPDVEEMAEQLEVVSHLEVALAECNEIDDMKDFGRCQVMKLTFEEK